MLLVLWNPRTLFRVGGVASQGTCVEGVAILQKYVVSRQATSLQHSLLKEDPGKTELNM